MIKVRRLTDRTIQTYISFELTNGKNKVSYVEAGNVSHKKDSKAKDINDSILFMMRKSFEIMMKGLEYQINNPDIENIDMSNRSINIDDNYIIEIE